MFKCETCYAKIKKFHDYKNRVICEACKYEYQAIFEGILSKSELGRNSRDLVNYFNKLLDLREDADDV